MFCKAGEAASKQVSDEIKLQVLVHGENMLMARFELSAGAHLPKHDHPHEQTGYVVSGRARLNLEGEEPFETGPGGAWSIPGGVPHSADALEDSVIIEVFYPVREDFLQK